MFFFPLFLTMYLSGLQRQPHRSCPPLITSSMARMILNTHYKTAFIEDNGFTVADCESMRSYIVEHGDSKKYTIIANSFLLAFSVTRREPCTNIVHIERALAIPCELKENVYNITTTINWFRECYDPCIIDTRILRSTSERWNTIFKLYKN